jgi:acyl-coenzyme A synthetase/AMP-(fatty) acid ligase
MRAMGHLPITAEYVDYHAARNPRRVALVEPVGHVTYAELSLLVRRCAQELQALGVRRGMRVAISGPGFGIELILLLAAEGLGAVTASFGANDDTAAPDLWRHADWVFSGQPQQVAGPARFHLADQAFVHALRSPVPVDGVGWTPQQPHEPQRILRTSGSTGLPKLMLLTRVAQDWWIRCALESWQGDQGEDSRVVLLCPLVVTGGFMRAHAVLRQGGALLSAKPPDLARMAPTSIFGLPVHVQRLLRDLPADFEPRQPVGVGMVGASAGAGLREHAAAFFRGPVHNRYACNEAGPVCDDVSADGRGTVRPGVDVRILDEDGQEVPPGEPGVIAVRSPVVVAGYLGDEQATAAAFRDGWFITGDAGVLASPRSLRLAGRHDDLVNLGGIKVPAALVAEQLAGIAGIAESAVLAVVLPQGSGVGIAIVLAPGATREAVVTAVQAAVQTGGATALAVACLPALPRSPGGKVDRQALLRIFGGH